MREPNSKKKAQKTVILIIIVVTSAIALFAASVSAATLHGFPYSEDIGVTLLNQDPDPVEPGKYVDIRFMLENYGERDAENITFVILPKYPFSLDAGESAEQSIGRINGAQMGKDSVIVKYRLRVDTNAVDGKNPISIKYQTANNKGYVWIDNINISVRTRNVRLLVEDVKVIPEKVSPGDVAEITIKVKNIFSSPISNVRFRLYPNSTYFSTLNTDESIITYLGPGEESEISFNVISNGDTPSKVYPFSLVTDFSDNLNVNYSKTNTISVVVDEKPSYMLNLDDTKVFLADQKGKVTVSISNTGQADMKYTVVELLASDDYEILSAPKSYLGILESDDFQTAEFTIYAKSRKEAIPLLVRISYKDSYNRQIEDENIINLRIYSASDAKKYGLIASDSKAKWFLILIVLGVAGFIVYRKLRPNKQRKKA